MTALYGFLMLFAPPVVWFLVARYQKAQGDGAIVRHAKGLGCYVASFVAIGIIGALLLPSTEVAKDHSPTPSPVTSAQSKSTAPSKSVVAIKTTPKPTPKPKPKPRVATFNLTPTSFVSNYNRVARKAGLETTYVKSTSRGEVNDVFQCNLNEHAMVNGTIDKGSGRLKEITIICGGDGTAMSGANILLAMVNSVAAVTPELSSQERGDILRDLGIGQDETDLSDHKAETVRGHTKYWIQTGSIGIFFGMTAI